MRVLAEQIRSHSKTRLLLIPRLHPLQHASTGAIALQQAVELEYPAAQFDVGAGDEIAARHLEILQGGWIQGDASAAELIDLGVSPTELYDKLYHTFSPARFRLLVTMLDRLELHVKKVKRRGAIWRFACEAKVDGALVAEAEISAILADSPAA